jgi:hypothetical protein
MVTPGLISLADALADGPGTLNDLLNEGLSADLASALRFFVIVPEVGACQVPQKALSHLQAKRPHFLGQNLREHWSGQIVSEWAISLDGLWLLEDEWAKRTIKLSSLALALSPPTVRVELGFVRIEELASLIACAILELPPGSTMHRSGQAAGMRERFEREWREWMLVLLDLVQSGQLPLRNAQGLEFSGPFDEGYVSSAELLQLESRFQISTDDAGIELPRRVRFELYKPGYNLRSKLAADGSLTTGWFPVEDVGEKVLAQRESGRVTWRPKSPERSRDITPDLMRVLQTIHAAGKVSPPGAFEVVTALSEVIRRGDLLDSVTDVLTRDERYVGLAYVTNSSGRGEIGMKNLQKRLDRMIERLGDGGLPSPDKPDNGQ